MPNGDLEKIINAIASAPAHCDVQSQKQTAIWLKREKSLKGFQILAESYPDLIEQSPILHKRTYTNLSTSARIIYEFGLDGSIGAAAVAMGYFSAVHGDQVGLDIGSVGPYEVREGCLKKTIQYLINQASSIGAGLFAIGSEELNLWPKENAIMRIEEDLGSLLLHVKLTLSPFASILIIPTGDMFWLTKKISLQRVCKDIGMNLVGEDRFGRIRLEWNPPVPRVQSTPLWKFPSNEKSGMTDRHTSFSELLKSTQEKLPQKIMLQSSRSALARKQNSATSKKPSQKKKSSKSPCTPGNSSEQSQAKTPVSALVFYQEEMYADLDLE